MRMAGEVLEDETMKELSIDFLVDQVQSWRQIWEQAAIHAASFPASARQIILRKTSDPSEALKELIPLIAEMHPDVIDFMLAVLETATIGLGRLQNDPSDREVVEHDRSLEERVERLETIIQGMGAVTHPLRD